MKKAFALLCFLLFTVSAWADNGYDLWLHYSKVTGTKLLRQYRSQIVSPLILGTSPTIQKVREEFRKAITVLLDNTTTSLEPSQTRTVFMVGVAAAAPHFTNAVTAAELKTAGSEGYIIKSKPGQTYITANTDIGVLYGMFHYLRLLQTHQDITHLNIVTAPKLQLRLLNHWDNLNRTVERGYAGCSIWDWHKLPGYIDQRYIDYARANASIGINGTVLNNVNANATILTAPYLQKVKALADVFRPYGIKVYLTARFSSPIEIGGLKTADPLNGEVQQFWNNKAKEIYELIPDFGGFLVKANSEGQPGPQDYHRTHADGANMLATALEPYHGVVIWRAFVYAAENPVDRHKQAYDDFAPLDEKFKSNVLVQVKNGAIDFMPREPFHPLFGAMPNTPLMMEFQITQEYTGQGTSLVYLAPLFKETLESDTYCKGKGSTVAKIIDGTLEGHHISGMAGISNIGSDMNWCGHPFAQANWYAYGRLCWDHELSSDTIAEEWLRMTFGNENKFIATAKAMMLQSRETMVEYMNPMGLHHIMGTGNHYGPAPWVSDQKRPEWNPVYYHKADSAGIGFDRTATGSNALAQYFPPVQQQWNDMKTCDEKYLLWFHHVPWTFITKSGRSLWNELCYHYYHGAENVKAMQQTWNSLQAYVDAEQFSHVKQLLAIQYDEAVWWRNACLLYFQTFSKMPIPAGYEAPAKTLAYYKSLRFPFAPGN
ncbi:MAG: alpha-glucuronidase [Bacteroidetes bacterium]|nr:alpha-glucuronidase [Bacteroidota bacterium]